MIIDRFKLNVGLQKIKLLLQTFSLMLVGKSRVRKKVTCILKENVFIQHDNKWCILIILCNKYFRFLSYCTFNSNYEFENHKVNRVQEANFVNSVTLE